MPLSRLLPLLLGLILVLGLMIWLVYTISRLYTWVSFSSPLLANVLLILLAALLVILIGAVIYYLLLFQGTRRRSPQRKKQRPKVSTLKPEAAEETLQAVRQQVDQIQDQVARQALIARSQEIAENLARRELRVVVFGTGSAGKTSIVNALMGRMVGQIGAPMGTTEVGETYSLKLKGLEREIWITDTPGILEAGVAGTEREQVARQLATEADLLLFVLDDDLRQSEFKPLRALAKIGKRSLLVLNKIDRYTEADREVILGRLRDRVQEFIAPGDVVAIAARPQAVRLETGEILEPDPQIMPLIRRIAAVLRAEGEELVADNILLQSQRLGEEARQLIDVQRISLAKTLAGLGIVRGVVQIVTSALRLSISGFLVGTAIQSVSAAYLTRIAGKSFIEYFRNNQDWGDGGITEVVQQQFQLNRRDEFIKTFVQEALSQLPKKLGRDVEFPPSDQPGRPFSQGYDSEQK